MAERDKVYRHYIDLYANANRTINVGIAIKIFGIGCFIFTLVITGSHYILDGTHPYMLFGGGLYAFGVGAIFYVIGILVCTQGYLFKTTLDIAVNTSPLMTDKQKGDILTISQSPKSPWSDLLNRLHRTNSS